MNSFWKASRNTRLAAAGMALLLAFGAASGARAEEEGEFAKNILGKIGLIPEDRDPIQYRERAPLVLPPKADLPPPVSSNLGERKAINWPKDPDVAAARERAKEAKTPRTQTEEYLANQNPRLSPEKLRSTRSVGRDPNDRTPTGPAMRNNDSARLTPEQLRSTASKYNDEATAPGAEPDRQDLTDPPTGYRKAAGGGTIKPTYDPPDRMDPGSPYYLEHERRKREQEQ